MPILSILKGKTARALALAAFCLALPCAAFAAPAADPLAGVKNLKLSYAIYLGGLHLMDSTTEFTRNGPVYHINMKAGTQGLARRLIPWDADLTSSGEMKGETIRPAKGVIVTRWKEDPTSVEFNYKDGREVKSVFTPKSDNDHNEDVPDEMLADALDPLNGIVQLMAGVAYGKGCAQTLPIYDGHRRFDVSLKDGGSSELKGEDYSVFTGMAQKCEVQFAMRAGSRKDREGSKFWEDGKNAGSRAPIYIYLAKVRPNLPPMPVRAETDTFFGGVMIHLTTLEGGEAKTASR
jgi:hypothetical protein